MSIQNRIEKHPLQALCLAVALLGGCASAVAPQPDGVAPAQTQATTSEEIVAQRAQARLNHIIKGEYDKAYAYMAPSYRALVGLEKFKTLFEGGSGRWVGARIIRVNCPGEARCDVRVGASMNLLMLRNKTVETGLDEIWVLEDGQWWNYRDI